MCEFWKIQASCYECCDGFDAKFKIQVRSIFLTALIVQKWSFSPQGLTPIFRHCYQVDVSDDFLQFLQDGCIFIELNRVLGGTQYELIGRGKIPLRKFLNSQHFNGFVKIQSNDSIVNEIASIQFSIAAKIPFENAATLHLEKSTARGFLQEDEGNHRFNSLSGMFCSVKIRLNPDTGKTSLTRLFSINQENLSEHYRWTATRRHLRQRRTKLFLRLQILHIRRNAHERYRVFFESALQFQRSSFCRRERKSASLSFNWQIDNCCRRQKRRRRRSRRVSRKVRDCSDAADPTR